MVPKNPKGDPLSLRNVKGHPLMKCRKSIFFAIIEKTLISHMTKNTEEATFESRKTVCLDMKLSKKFV